MVLGSVFAVASAAAQTTPPSTESAAASGGSPIDPGVAWSIFNHRGAGWFILVWGAAALVVGLQWPRRTWARFVPPLVLFAMVEFLFLRNDPEAWPTGPI